jgi:hypothetical protein
VPAGIPTRQSAGQRQLTTLATVLQRLSQRRALRGAGADPNDADTRNADTVERYLQ